MGLPKTFDDAMLAQWCVLGNNFMEFVMWNHINPKVVQSLKSFIFSVDRILAWGKEFTHILGIGLLLLASRCGIWNGITNILITELQRH